MNTSKYFSESELQCKCCKKSVFAPGFLESIDDLREACGHPLSASSAARCDAHNEAEGGKTNSFHLISKPWGCCAIDIKTVGWIGAKKWAFVRLAMERGFSVGIASTFIHIDRRHVHDKDWPKPVLFTY
jgi:zinc D-Ala-D-Ala carboxypeptidase